MRRKVASGHILQAALKGRGWKQVLEEVHKLQKKGKIRSDFADQKNGLESLAEVLQFIDEETPDEDRLRAVKAMLVALNASESKAGDEILNYRLLKIAKKVTATQVAILAVCFNNRGVAMGNANPLPMTAWRQTVAGKLGNGWLGLVESEEPGLSEMGLMAGAEAQGWMQQPLNWGLTDLGIRFCQHLEAYKAIETALREQ